MNYRTLIAAVSTFGMGLVCTASAAAAEVSLEQVAAAIQRADQPPPTLLINARQEQIVQTHLQSDPFFNALADAIIQRADRYVGGKPVQRVMTGRRLLSVSRECLTRLSVLAAAFGLTEDFRYRDQAQAEMLAAAAFSDWNPSHFLDTAEMTAALGIGYDRFYNVLSDEARLEIRTAIIEKGLNPSFTPNQWWITAENNWNQVCHGGLTIGALAIRREAPELAARVIHRAISNIPRAMNEYEPDGAYPEGPGYWSYGTSYNVAMIAALESVLGTDFGLSERKGFAAAGDYYLHVSGPSGLYFNYADCGRGGSVDPTMFWFAYRYDKPYLLFHQLPMLWPKDAEKITHISWLSPMLLLWGQTETQIPPRRHWLGRGQTPVAIFRSSWTEPDAAYLAVKGGCAFSNHAHMDAGSFVYEADGVRWALDLGMQNYTRMESRGLDIWNRGQNSDRWKIFRYSNFAHNTLTVNGQLHNVRGVARIIRFSDADPRPFAVIEMSEVFENQLAKVDRGVALLDTRQALIQDEWAAGEKPAAVRWAMVAPGKADILSPTVARLSEKGKTLLFELHCPEPTHLKLYSTEPPNEWDEPNPNTYLIGFEITLKPRQAIRLAVTLTPGSVDKKRDILPLKPLSQWTNQSP